MARAACGRTFRICEVPTLKGACLRASEGGSLARDRGIRPDPNRWVRNPSIAGWAYYGWADMYLPEPELASPWKLPPGGSCADAFAPGRRP